MYVSQILDTYRQHITEKIHTNEKFRGVEAKYYFYK